MRAPASRRAHGLRHPIVSAPRRFCQPGFRTKWPATGDVLAAPPPFLVQSIVARQRPQPGELSHEATFGLFEDARPGRR